ncbi:MAG: hypothetical protein ACFE9R_21705 [Candidatus Hermodarchaeota archaeon]
MINLSESPQEKLKKLNRNFKTRNSVYIVLCIIFILSMLPFIPFWYNISNAMQTFGIGHYYTDKKYVSDYGNESVGIYIELDISLTQYEDTDIITGGRQIMYGYHVITSISMISHGNITPLGFIFRVLIHYVGERAVEHDSGYLNPPREVIQFDSGYIMKKQSVCNSSGRVTYLFQRDSIVYNQTTFYKINYIIPYGELDYNNFKLMFYSILGLYLLFIGLIPFILLRIIKPTFGIEFDEIDLERERRFKEYVEKKVTSKSQKADNIKSHNIS